MSADIRPYTKIEKEARTVTKKRICVFVLAINAFVAMAGEKIQSALFSERECTAELYSLSYFDNGLLSAIGYQGGAVVCKINTISDTMISMDVTYRGSKKNKK